MKFKSFFKNKRSGFTVVELLVAMSIFVVLVTVATSAFIQALRGERRLLSLMSVTNNASLALEQVAREIRTGYLFNDATLDINPVACSSGLGETHLIFKSQASGTSSIVSYGLDTNENGANVLTRSSDDFPGVNSSSITADNVNVSNLCFVVSQLDSQGDNNLTQCYPWRVTILMTVSSLAAGSSTNPMSLETTVSSRILPAEVPRDDKSGTAVQACSL
jgi:prepilin-type N-terminal cleavage/methylation domain-containing protein